MNIYKITTKIKKSYIIEDVTTPTNALRVFLNENKNYIEEDVVSIELVDEYDDEEHNDFDYIGQFYEKLKPYMWRGCCRSSSPQETKYRDMKLEDIECPICGKKALWLPQYGDFGFNEYYRVECDECDYVFPIQMSDCGECICEAKTQLGLYELLGKPHHLLDCDLSLLLHKSINKREESYLWLCNDDQYVNKTVHKKLLEIDFEKEDNK